MMITLLLILPATVFHPTPQVAVTRDGLSLQVPMLDNLTDAKWGPATRTADHAVVVMGPDKSILVAYHTDRSDLDASLKPKQVEAALFAYSVTSGGVETWTHVKSFLLGSTPHNPLQTQGVQHVKCERPDVVATGNRYFVVWTRIYQHNPADKEPAVSECAWIDIDPVTGTPTVYDHFGASSEGSGRGFALDNNYKVFECAGVPDAVVLNDGTGASLPEVAVVYPAWFGSGPNLTRAFDLKIATCQLDTANPTTPILSTAPANLFTSQVLFNGPDNMAAGLILPDLARGIDEDQFLLVYEEQLYASGNPYGVIRMHRIVRTATAWAAAQSNTIGNAQTLIARRRPNISSYPQNGNTVNNASIAFNTYSFPLPNTDANVVYSEWNFDPDNGIYKVPWPVPLGQPPLGWPNAAYDFRPIPLHGAEITLRRCYAESFPGSPPPPASGCDLAEYDLYSNPQALLSLAHAPLGRPAVAYLHDPNSVGSPDYITLTWEQRLQDTPELWRIVLLVR